MGQIACHLTPSNINLGTIWGRFRPSEEPWKGQWDMFGALGGPCQVSTELLDRILGLLGPPRASAGVADVVKTYKIIMF